MFATATLVAHRGATLISREKLAEYDPPEPEGRWKPVKHSLIVDLMHEELERRKIAVVKEEYAVQRDGNSLFAALTTNWLDTGETAAAIAFRHANDKSEAMKMHAGVRVFICDNMALSGDEIILNRKHTARLNVATELTKAFDRYKNGALILQRNIEDLKAGALALGDAQRKLFEIFGSAPFSVKAEGHGFTTTRRATAPRPLPSFLSDPPACSCHQTLACWHVRRPEDYAAAPADASRMRCRIKSTPARPYACRLINTYTQPLPRCSEAATRSAQRESIRRDRHH